jgi:hypothetical protein
LLKKHLFELGFRACQENRCRGEGLKGTEG